MFFIIVLLFLNDAISCVIAYIIGSKVESFRNYKKEYSYMFFYNDNVVINFW